MIELDNAYDADINSDINSDEDIVNNKYCVKCKHKRIKFSKPMKRINKKTNKKLYKIEDLLKKLKL